MAEESKSGFKKGLLIGVLAGVILSAVVALGVAVVRDRYKAWRASFVDLYVWNRDVMAGNRVSILDARMVTFPRGSCTTVPNHVVKRGQEHLLDDVTISHAVAKDDWVKLEDLMNDQWEADLLRRLWLKAMQASQPAGMATSRGAE